MGRNDTNENKQSQLLTNQPEHTKHGHVEDLEKDFVYEVISFEYHPQNKIHWNINFNAYIFLSRPNYANNICRRCSDGRFKFYN